MLLALALIAGVFLVYQPAWRAGFIWDDETHVTRPGLRDLEGLKQIWADPPPRVSNTIRFCTPFSGSSGTCLARTHRRIIW
jgi:hypothetical protein